MRPVSQDWEKCLFYLTIIKLHREPGKMKKQMNIIQIKEQSKSLEIELNVTEISDLSDRSK